MFHAIAYGGTQETDLFQRIVGQSPGPQVGHPKTQKLAGEAFLRTLGVNSVDEARQLPTSKLIKANAMVESESPYFGMSAIRNEIKGLDSHASKQVHWSTATWCQIFRHVSILQVAMYRTCK